MTSHTVQDQATERKPNVTSGYAPVNGLQMYYEIHGVALFRLLGGGVPGDNVGLPNAQLAILPGTSHVTLVQRADLLLPILSAFLNAPMPKADEIK